MIRHELRSHSVHCNKAMDVCSSVVFADLQRERHKQTINNELTHKLWQIVCQMHTIQSHVGSMGRVSSAITWFLSLSNPCTNTLAIRRSEVEWIQALIKGITEPKWNPGSNWYYWHYMIFASGLPLPLGQEPCQSELYGLDKHSHTYQHLRHCKLRYPTDNQPPKSKSRQIKDC